MQDFAELSERFLKLFSIHAERQVADVDRERTLAAALTLLFFTLLNC